MLFYLVIFVGITAISSAAILIKLCSAPAIVIAFYRLAIAAVLMWLITLAKGHSQPEQLKGKLGYLALSGLLLCVHFAAWILSFELTSVLASVTLVSTSPLFVLIGSILFFKKKPEKTIFPPIALATLGAIVISSQENSGNTSLLGNSLALIGAIAMAGYLLIGQKLRSNINIVYYVSIIYTFGALFTLPMILLSGHSLFVYSHNDYFLMLMIALAPQMIGHTAINWALRHISAITVAIIALGEPIVTPVLALFILKENITAIQLTGGTLILTGVIIAAKLEQVYLSKPEEQL